MFPKFGQKSSNASVTLAVVRASCPRCISRIGERETRSPQPARCWRYVEFFLTACLFLALNFGLVAAQNGDSALLIRFEKSLKQGKFEQIERPLFDYAIAHPQDAKALSLLAEVRYLQNRLLEAKGLNKRALTLNPNLTEAKINLGRVSYELGERDEARQILDDINPATLTASSDQFDLAATLFFVGESQKALGIAENLPLKLKNNEALPLLAAINWELGDSQKFNELIPLMKKSAVNQDLAVQCAEVLQNAGMQKEAADLLRQALAANPNNPRILILLGRSEIALKEPVLARQHLSRAAVLEPNSAEAVSAQALLENATGNLAAALKLLGKARELAPNSTTVISDYVLTAMRANQSQLAVDAAKKLVELKPSVPEFQYLFGAASLQNGNIQSAQEALENFVRERPLDSRGCLALGLALATARDQIEAARNQLGHCLQIDPNNFEARYQLGLSYKTAGETATAVKLLEEVTKQAPDYAAALRDLGALYLQTGAEKQARAVLERAATLNPEDADTHFQLSRLYNLIGETALAKQHLETFQRLKNQGGNPLQ